MRSSLPLIIVKPHVGVLVWSWIGYMNPHRLTWGFTYDFPFAMLVGLATIGAWLLSREPKTLPWHPLVLLLAVFGVYLAARSVIRLAREDRELSWAADLAAMVQVSIAGYAVAGLFLNLATFDLYYHLVAVVVIASALVRQRVASGVSSGSAERATAFERPSDARA